MREWLNKLYCGSMVASTIMYVDHHSKLLHDAATYQNCPHLLQWIPWKRGHPILIFVSAIDMTKRSWVSDEATTPNWFRILINLQDPPSASVSKMCMYMGVCLLLLVQCKGQSTASFSSCGQLWCRVWYAQAAANCMNLHRCLLVPLMLSMLKEVGSSVRDCVKVLSISSEPTH